MVVNEAERTRQAATQKYNFTKTNIGACNCLLHKIIQVKVCIHLHVEDGGSVNL